MLLVNAALFPFALLNLFSYGALAAVQDVYRDTARSDYDGATTNAQRLARGLPPLPPKRRYSPTRVRRSSPSGVVNIPIPPSVTYTGRLIASYETNSTQFGYLGKNLTSTGSFQITQNVSDALVVEFETDSSTLAEVLPIQIKDGPVGFLSAIATNGTNFDAGTQDFGVLGASTVDTPVNNTVYTATSTETPAETSIWDFNVTSGGVSASWLASDQFARSVTFLLVAADNLVFAASGVDDAAPAVFNNTLVVNFRLDSLAS